MTKTCPDCHATVLSTSQPERMDEVLRLLRKISDLAYDEDVGEPLDCAIDYAKKAIAALAATPAFEINPFANEPAATPAVGGEREALADELNGLFNAYLKQRYGIGKQAILDALWDNKAFLIAALRAPPASPLRGREPDAYSLVFDEWYGVNAETTFKTLAKAEDYVRDCAGPKPRIIPLYASPPEQRAAALLKEGIEILDNLLASIRKHGNYSAESTITFIDQSLQCFRAAAPKPWIDAGEGDMS